MNTTQYAELARLHTGMVIELDKTVGYLEALNGAGVNIGIGIDGDTIAREGHLWTTKNLWGMVHESTDEGLDSGDGYFGLPRTAAWQAVVDASMGRRYYLSYDLPRRRSYETGFTETCRSMVSALVRLQRLMLDHGDALTKVRLVSRIG